MKPKNVNEFNLLSLPRALNWNNIEAERIFDEEKSMWD